MREQARLPVARSRAVLAMRRIRFKLKDLSRCRSGSAVPALAPQCLELAFELGDRPGDLSRAAIRCRSPVVGDARDRAVPLHPQCLETRFEFRKSSHHPDSLPVTDFERRPARGAQGRARRRIPGLNRPPGGCTPAQKFQLSAALTHAIRSTSLKQQESRYPAQRGTS
jgi:hypothetical protein